MPRITIPIVGQESRSRSMRVDEQQTRNFVTARSAPGGKEPFTLESAPGLVEIGAAGNGPCRTPSMVQWRGATYSVFGSEFVQHSVSQGLVSIGSIATTEGIVRIARGRTFLLLVDGRRGYTYDGTTFAVVDDIDFPDERTGRVPTHVVYIDSTFVVNDANTDFFYISNYLY